MDLHDKRKPGGAVPRQNDADGKRKPVSVRDEDLLDDVEFDLLDETEEASNDFFSRDTAIPASPPEQLAAEAMRQVDAEEKKGSGRAKSKPAKPRGKPKLPPPPVRTKHLPPITLEPPPEELDFDSFDEAIDVFGNHLPGTPHAEPKPRHPFADAEPKPRHPFADAEPKPRHPFAHSELPTAPPGAVKALPAQAKRTSPAPERATRNAFLAETKRNRPIDPELLARANLPGSNGRARPPASDSALDFIDELDPLLDSLSPMPSSKPPPPALSGTPRAGAKELEQCYALGDYNRALTIAEEMLARSPDDLSARRYAQNCRDALTQMFAARIGPLDQVMSVVVSPEEVQWLSLDHRAGFLLSLVDGQSTVDEILDISGMTRLDALKIIHDLAEQQVVRLA
jgi:hypothetical protein